MNALQSELLSRARPDPLEVNQLQLPLTNATMIARGANVNTGKAAAVDRDGGVLDYFQLQHITSSRGPRFSPASSRGCSSAATSFAI
jgi:predicted oxidoreductase